MKRKVEVVEFVDPYVRRRRRRDVVHGPKVRKNEANKRKVDDPGGNRSMDRNISADFFAKLDKRKIFEEVLAISVGEAADKDTEALKKQLEKEKLASLGCDVSERKDIPYKQLQAQRKLEKEHERKLRDQQQLTNELASSILNTSRHISRLGKYNSSRRRKLAFEKEKRRQRRNTRTNQIIGDLDAPKLGSFKDGVLRLSKSEIDS